MIKNNKGSTLITAPIIWLMTIFIFVFFIVSGIEMLAPFIIYQKVSATSLKYIFIMEEFGYLNSADEDNLKKELVAKGLDFENIIVDATREKREYGEILDLCIKYEYQYRKGDFRSSFVPYYDYEPLEICVSKRGVCKR